MTFVATKNGRALTRALLDERVAFARREKSIGGAEYRAAQRRIQDVLRSIGRAGNAAEIVAAEEWVLLNERQFFGADQAVQASVKAALNDVGDVKMGLSLLESATDYERFARHFENPKNSRGGVPFDPARKGLVAHSTRLLNLDKSRMTEEERETIKLRRGNLRVVEREYIARQRKTLGLPSPAQSRDRSREAGLDP